MLKDDLYAIESLRKEENIISATVTIDATHKIFDGHFPGQPVLPGVCTVEILKELVSEQYGRSYNLQSANNMKFLSLVDPTQSNKLVFTIECSEEDNSLKINASASLEDETVTFKLKGVLV